MQSRWDHVVDALIVGSGAAGMVAALSASASGLDVLIVEKTQYYGGTTATSGGGIWVPNNPVLRRARAQDSVEEAQTYLDACLTEQWPPRALRHAYLAAGPAAIRFLEQTAHMRFEWTKGYPDYRPELPGGKPLGRQIQASAFDTRALGSQRSLLRPSLRLAPMPFGMWIMTIEGRQLALVGRTWSARYFTVKLALRGLLAQVQGKKMASMGGQMLIARLRAALLDAQVPLWTQSPMTRLISDEDGTVRGAVVTRDGQALRIRARAGVVLATGGFERNAEMRHQYQAEPVNAVWTLGCEGNTGDGIRAAQAIGADIGLMDDAWWGPGIELPSGAAAFCLNERQLPGSLMVNGAGERYTNEAAPYIDVAHAMYAGQATGVTHIPSWLVIDAKCRKRYKLGPLLPRQPVPRDWYTSGIAATAPTIALLAAEIGVPAGTLQATVARFNSFAEDGKDIDFGRGESAYDRYYADPTIKPNPTLGPVVDPPFYAVKIVPSDLGTKGGLTINEHAQVLRADGTAIARLYAAGNTSRSVMGHDYPGPGATIGPAVTFGYLAGQHLAGQVDSAASSA